MEMPEVVSSPIALSPRSIHHNVPFVAAVICIGTGFGSALVAGIGTRLTSPVVVIVPIAAPFVWVNARFPLGSMQGQLRKDCRSLAMSAGWGTYLINWSLRYPVWGKLSPALLS